MQICMYMKVLYISLLSSCVCVGITSILYLYHVIRQLLIGLQVPNVNYVVYYAYVYMLCIYAF